jgi:hypothetical protein
LTDIDLPHFLTEVIDTGKRQIAAGHHRDSSFAVFFHVPPVRALKVASKVGT